MHALLAHVAERHRRAGWVLNSTSCRGFYDYLLYIGR